MKKITHMRNRYILLIDIAMILVSVLGGYALRMELGPVFFFYLPSAIWMAGISLVIKPVIYHVFGLYRRLWVYASIQDLRLIVVSVTAATILVSILMIALLSMGAFVGFPRSILIIDWLLSILLVGGARFAVRLLSENRTKPTAFGRLSRRKHALVIGAGDAGALVVREMQKKAQSEVIPIGFLDDDPTKQKHEMFGVPVLGRLNDLANVFAKHRIDEVIFAIPSAPGAVVRQVSEICRTNGVPFRTIPSFFELIGGKVSVNRLREVEIADLLRRQPINVKEKEVEENLHDKVILVTGGGGSIGLELCRQICRWNPAQLILLGHGENSIFEAVLDLQGRIPENRIHPVIADLRDPSRLRKILHDYQPEIIFHTAAHKHVPLMELNIEEAISNNIQGTQNIINAALEHGTQQLVMISSDKAIRPVSIMGATKRIAEMIVLDAARRSGRFFSVVRFGNVLGSRGSVVPIFKQQIAKGGPITITHPDMKRYFMTIPEAVHLVLQAASMGLGNEKFILNMGNQIRIVDLANDLIRLSGLEPGADIEIVFTGVRPGEKLSEDLWDDGHEFKPTTHPDIYRDDSPECLSGEQLTASLERIYTLANQGDLDEVIRLFDAIIPGAAVSNAAPVEMFTY